MATLWRRSASGPGERNEAPDPSTFSEQQRDLFIASGSLGFWQAALRNPDEERYERTSDAIGTAGRITVDLLHADHEAANRRLSERS